MNSSTSRRPVVRGSAEPLGVAPARSAVVEPPQGRRRHAPPGASPPATRVEVPALAQALSDVLRSDDLVVRSGSHAFLCGLAGGTVRAAAERADVAAVIEGLSAGTTVSVRLAVAREGDTAASVLRLVDDDLHDLRRRRRRTVVAAAAALGPRP